VGEPVELLSERHRDGILELGPADLQHARELGALLRERLGELHVLREQPLSAEHHRELDRRRIDVVGALAAIHVIDRVQAHVVAEWLAHEFEAAVRDDLVRVHVRRRAGTALDHADHELVVERAVDDLLADPVDEVGLESVEGAELLVRTGRGLLHDCERSDEIRVDGDRPAGDREVLPRPRSMDAPVGTGRNLHGTDRIALGPCGTSRRDDRQRARRFTHPGISFDYG
jgi:hypothetical protein